MPARHRGATLANVLVALSVVVALVTSCSSGNDSDAGERQGRGQNRSGLDWQSCSIGRGAQCATLEVPLDWSNPSGQKIRLALGRLPATGRADGSILMNPGGPGGSGLDLLSYDPSTPAMSESFDRVSWDPRGVGESQGLQCGDALPELIEKDPDPDSAEEQAAIEDAAAEVSAECGASDPALLQHMRTTDSARDMEAIRVALGEDKLDYLGFSYGTHLGQAYAALFPDKVGRMVLDGIVDPLESFTEFLLGQTRAFDSAFDRQVHQCARAGVASCGVRDLDRSFDKVRTTVEAEPIAVGNRSVGPAEVAMAGITTSYQPSGYLTLGPAVRDALKGDGRAILEISDSYQDMASYASYAAVICSDGPTPRGVEAYREFVDQAKAISPRFGGAVANELLPCATWPVETPSTTTLPVGDIPPILLIANTGDPATPIDNARRVHDRLPSSVLVEVDSDGHTAVGSNACVNEVVNDYLIDGVVPKDRVVRC